MTQTEPARIVSIEGHTTRFKHMEVLVSGKRQDEIALETWDAIREAVSVPGRYALSCGQLFLHEGRPVFLNTNHYPPRIEPATQALMFTLANHCVQWHVKVKGGVRIGQQPQWLKSVLLAAPPGDLPRLHRIATTPFFDRDGRWVSDEGYNADSETWLALGGTEWSNLPGRVHPDLVRDAADYFVHDLLGDFPFASQADLAHAVAMFIVPLVRDMIHGPCMAACIEAPTPGSGKTKLANTFGVFATGGPVQVTPLDRTESEVRKAITATLSAGEPVLLFDNVAGYIDSPALAALLSANTWHDRILGGSVMAAMPVTAQVMLTGNNVRLSGELTDRMTRIRLVPLTDKPRQRTGFRHPNLEAFMAKTRERAIWYTALMVRHWMTTGANYTGPVQGTFESYCHVVGGILEAAGIEGFLNNRNEFTSEAATSEGEWLQLVNAWFERHGESEVTAGQLNEICDELGVLTFLRGTNRPTLQLSYNLHTTLRQRVFNNYMIVRRETPVGQAHRFRLQRVQ